MRSVELRTALLRLGEYVADHGLEGDGPYQAARDLLMRREPRVGGRPLRLDGETALAAARRLALALDGGVMPIQGPFTMREAPAIQRLTWTQPSAVLARNPCCIRRCEITEPRHSSPRTRNFRSISMGMGAVDSRECGGTLRQGEAGHAPFQPR